MEKKKSRKILKIIMLTVVGAILLSLLSGFVYYCSIHKDLIRLDEKKLVTVNANPFSVYGANDLPLNETVPLKNAANAKVENLSENTKNAFIAIEDKRFYSHGGVDTVRIGGALISNVKSGNLKEGASTITQQLIKNTFLSNEKSLKRKVNEVKLARDLEKRFSKDEILEMYLNTIYFGNNAYGIESASRIYFNSKAENLTLSQGALLAGLIKAPNKYAPTSNAEACLSRRNTVLKCMLEQNMISSEDYSKAINEPLCLDLINKNAFFTKRYMHCAIQEACEILNINESQLSASGIKIYTYCDNAKQEVVENSIAGIKAKTVAGNTPESCAIIVNNATKGVEAFCGYSHGNLYTQRRQLGSTAKPIAVYAPAINEGLITALSPVLDEQVNLEGYRPKNYMERYYGWTTIRNAVAKSLNSVSVKTLNELGVEKSCDYLSKNGIETQNESMSLALGSLSKGATVQSLNDAYTTFASSGQYAKSAFVRKIEDSDGKPLYNHVYKGKQVFSDKTSYIMTNILFSVVRDGTGRELKELPFELAAKSGTCGEAQSTNNTDAYFTSYTSEHTVTVWLGANEDGLPSKVSGGTLPALISKDIYSSIYKNNAPANFTIPMGVSALKIDIESLQKENKLVLANEFTPESEIVSEFFSDDNCPKAVSKRNIKPDTVVFSLKTLDGMLQIVIENAKKGTNYEIHRVSNGEDSIIFSGELLEKNTFTHKMSGSGVVNYYIVPINGKTLVRGDKSESKSIFVEKKEAKNPPVLDEKALERNIEDNSLQYRIRKLLGVKRKR